MRHPSRARSSPPQWRAMGLPRFTLWCARRGRRATSCSQVPIRPISFGRPFTRSSSSSGAKTGTLREVIRRNAEQDMALARRLDSGTLLPALKERLKPAAMGGEWYLGVRDLIYRLAGGHD